MPSPIGHALGGLIVGLLLSRPTTRPAPVVTPAHSSPIGPAILVPECSHRELFWLALAACLPDLDFIWGRHNMETHSLGFAVLVGLVVLAWSRSPRRAIVTGLAVASHVLFDWLGSDDSPPLGVMALWPLTDAFYFADAFVFEAISRRYWRPGFLQHNLLALLREIAILLPVSLLAWRWRRADRP